MSEVFWEECARCHATVCLEDRIVLRDLRMQRAKNGEALNHFRTT